jgi:hypothetical protein
MGTQAIAKPSLLLFSRSTNKPAFLDALNKGLTSARDIDYHLVSNAVELKSLVERSSRVVLFANCLMKEDIADLYNLLPQFETRVSQGILKILVLNSIGHPRLGSLLRSRATVEIIELPTTLKAIHYKLKGALTSVHQAYLKSSQGLKAGPKTKANRSKARGLDIRWQSASEFSYDFWWILDQKNIRNVVGVWLIDLLGPGPVAGVWEELPGVARTGEKGWAWRPRSGAEDIFQTPGGRWVFFGKMPEFSWQKNLWAFVSKEPMLAYYPEGASDPEYVRIEYRAEEGLLFVENSEYTKGLLPRIQATLESRLGGRTGDGGDGEEVTGSFEGWDIPEEDGGVDWKDHTGAEGVNFQAKDLRVDTRATPSGGGLSLPPVDIPGITTGANTFDRIEMRALIVRRNDSPESNPPQTMLYELNEAGSTLLISDLSFALGDRLLLRISLDYAETKMECLMDWELTSIDLTLEDAVMVSGTFNGGDFGPLFTLLDRLDARKKELKEFYSTARG